MMHELERFFLKRGAYAELYGTLSLSGKEERDIRDVGNMKIYLDSHFFAVAASNASSSTFVLPVDITAWKIIDHESKLNRRCPWGTFLGFLDKRVILLAYTTAQSLQVCYST